MEHTHVYLHPATACNPTAVSGVCKFGIYCLGDGYAGAKQELEFCGMLSLPIRLSSALMSASVGCWSIGQVRIAAPRTCPVDIC